MNYQVIKDEGILREFIEWLPELRDDEAYYVCLFARNKYAPELTHIKTDKAQLSRFVGKKDRLFDKIKQMECEIGAYKQKSKEVPQKALALYITPNPRNLYKASINFMVKLAHSIRDKNMAINLHSEAISQIQKTKSRTCYVHFDFDVGEKVDLTRRIVENQIKNKEALTWIKTRGGVHLLVDPKKVEEENAQTWYKETLKIQDMDQTGDNMIPVPGCTQGDFMPYFIK